MASRYGHKQFIPGIELWTESPEHLLVFLQNRVRESKSTLIITLNPLMVAEKDKNPEFEKALENSDVIVADGRGVRWAAKKIANLDVPLIPGVELAEKLIEIASKDNLPVVLIGAQDGVWQKARDNLSLKYPGLKIAGGHHGYFDSSSEPELIDRLASLNPLLVLVGMGFPRQEIFLFRHRERFPGAILIGVGGSLDIYSGLKKRAPAFFRKTGTEWLWRFITEPKRLKNLFKLIQFWFRVTFQSRARNG